MKCLKSEWDEFWELLGDDWCHDDDDLPEYDGMAKDSILEFTVGSVIWQGRGESKEVGNFIKRGDDGLDLVRVFKRWRKSKVVSTVIVELDKGRRDEFIVMVKRFGGKIVGE